MKKVLDVCCGSRMFWMDKGDDRALFLDNRAESHILNDRNVPGGRKLVIQPDVQSDFQNLPLPNNHFDLVVFDPPHLKTAGDNGWLKKKYGRLDGDWTQMLRNGFSECFRVLRNNGTLVFKWNEYQIPLSQILALTDTTPLFGHKSGRHSKTHWITFIKQ